MNEHEDVNDTRPSEAVVPGPLQNTRLGLAAVLYGDLARHGHAADVAMKQAFSLADKFLAYHAAVPPDFAALEVSQQKWRQEEEVKARARQLAVAAGQ